MRARGRVTKMLLAFLLLLLMPGGGYAQQGQGKLQGEYELLGGAPSLHQADQVVMEEFVNFTCPHCDHFRGHAQRLYTKYQTRLKREVVPVLFPTRSTDGKPSKQPDFPVRLFFVAERNGKGDEAEQILFDAAFRYGVDIYDAEVVSKLAERLELAKVYAAEKNAAWVDRKIVAAEARANAIDLHGTPTVVLQATIKAKSQRGWDAYIDNLDRLIEQLLKPVSS